MQLQVGLILAGFTCAGAFGQGAGSEPAPQFEVASIKPAAPQTGHMFRIGSTGGPGTKDPGRFTCENCDLAMLVTQAYDIKNYQLTSPGWMSSTRFDVAVKIPDGTTKEQFRAMLRNLLAERFKLAVHHDQKEMPVYELVVGKGGPKLKETVEDPAPKDAADGPPSAGLGVPVKMGKEGFPALPPGGGNRFMMTSGGKMQMQASGQTMEQFTNLLSRQVGKPVTDATGLKGKYDITLNFTADTAAAMGKMGIAAPPPSTEGGRPAADSDTGPTIFGAVQELGLKLESKKGMVDLVVVDHAEKVPTEN